MDLSKILTISGKSGLYKIISSTQSSIIAESLEDGKRIPVFANNRSSTLEDISIFTEEKDIPLKEVLWKMHEAEEGKKCSVKPKDNDESLQNYFEKIIPDYDKDRVYPSDIKKVIRWYNILLENKLITKPEEEDEKTEAKDKDQKQVQSKPSSEKPAQKAKSKPVKDTTKHMDSSAAQKGKTKNVKTKKI